MKKVIIVHGWEGSPDEPMLKWLAEEARKSGFEAVAPLMPEPAEPKIETWVPHLQNLVGIPDSDTFFIGHSIGCQAILRFLETLPEDTRIGGAVFIAGWYDVRNLETEEELRIVKPWLETPRKDEKVKRIINKAIVILSDNDEYVSLDNKKAWEEKIGAEVMIEHDKGHFNRDAGITELPSALKSLLELAS